MEWLTLEDLFEIHHQAIFRSGGSDGIRDRGGLESALAQAMQSFGGIDLYPTFLDKVAALGFFLIRNHPFIDGNKRIGHAALEIVLQMNGYEILADETEQEAVILALAGSELSIESFNQWVKSVVVLLNSSFMEVENL
ncbi:MAG TPA: type II toxin-antitoxin system death-on-curing family toxin [Candidatus Kapabacteria bacterium]|nr:type II toxin-antitoxin system death-on-curing family toxin [Candidatus Kapabacteria bacterium]